MASIVSIINSGKFNALFDSDPFSNFCHDKQTVRARIHWFDLNWGFQVDFLSQMKVKKLIATGTLKVIGEFYFTVEVVWNLLHKVTFQSLLIELKSMNSATDFTYG